MEKQNCQITDLTNLSSKNSQLIELQQVQDETASA